MSLYRTSWRENRLTLRSNSPDNGLSERATAENLDADLGYSPVACRAGRGCLGQVQLPSVRAATRSFTRTSTEGRR